MNTPLEHLIAGAIRRECLPGCQTIEVEVQETETEYHVKVTLPKRNPAVLTEEQRTFLL